MDDSRLVEALGILEDLTTKADAILLEVEGVAYEIREYLAGEEGVAQEYQGGRELAIDAAQDSAAPPDVATPDDTRPAIEKETAAYEDARRKQLGWDHDELELF